MFIEENMKKKTAGENPTLAALTREEEIVWINPDKIPAAQAIAACELGMKDVDEAESRLARFASFIRKQFPETEADEGLIESPLKEIPVMKRRLCDKYGADLQGRLLLKMDSHLAIAGSIKARGGIYEVLKHAEELAFEHGILKAGEDYARLADPVCKEFFGRYTVQVGSTGNLGLSIGIMSAAVGFKVIVHMSADAKQWKKDLLRSHGVTVVEYESDYSKAVEEGRALSDADPMSYFVDDENSKTLFLGYAVAAKRLKGQLADAHVMVDEEHPLFVYIPCGVGGAPGGVTFGLKLVFGDNVHCFFVEPTKAPCMVAGMASGLNNKICVQDLGLSGLTHADGLAVGRPSGFVGSVMKPFLSGEMTIADPKLYEYMRDLLETEEIFIEPSACAAFEGPVKICGDPEAVKYLKKEGLISGTGFSGGESVEYGGNLSFNKKESDDMRMKKSSHIVWATGGRLVPEKMREEYRNTYL